MVVCGGESLNGRSGVCRKYDVNLREASAQTQSEFIHVLRVLLVLMFSTAGVMCCHVKLEQKQQQEENQSLFLSVWFSCAFYFYDMVLFCVHPLEACGS